MRPPWRWQDQLGRGASAYLSPLLNSGREVRQRLLEGGPAVSGLQVFTARAHLRIGQQIADEVMHPTRPVDSMRDQFVGTGVRLALAALLQQLQAARHGPQWLLQVMGGDVGQLF
jgi:hypothetical protein